jgi:crotonobetainyl-CoA:carnitine CoA-transferase CaiB-like acyl-CoA transferase
MGTKLLEGVRVVEFAQFGSVPFGGRLLADMGAEVVKVEPLGGDPWRARLAVTDTEGLTFMAWNQGKRGVAIDLKSPLSSEVLVPLISSADAIITNYRPSALGRLGIDYEQVKAIKPDIVYVAVTATEGDARAAERAGYDLIGQVESGMLAADEKFGPGGVPMPVSSGAVVDMSTGYLTCFGVCAGLVRQRASGQGCLIETSLLAVGMGIMSASIFELLDRPDWNEPQLEQVKHLTREGASVRQIADFRRDQRGVDGAGPAWFWRCYEAADRTIAVACLTQAQQNALLQQVIVDPEESGDIGELLAAGFRRRRAEEWVAHLEQFAVPVAIVRQAEELLDDPALQAAGLVVPTRQPHPVAGHFRTTGALLRVDGERPAAMMPSPALGQHSAEILTELGISGEQERALWEQGVVGGHPNDVSS